MTSKRGEGDGPDRPGEHGSDDNDEDKVVRLPRDWLGPRDELVPFGPSAEHDDLKAESASVPDQDEGSSTSPEAISPDDFWGERSASLQGPLDDAEGDRTSEPQHRRVRVAGAVAAAAVAVVVLVLLLVGGTSGPGKPHISAGLNPGGAHGASQPLLTQKPAPGHRTPTSRRRSKMNRSSRSHPSGAVAVKYVRESSSQSATPGGGSGTGSSDSASSNTSTNSTSPGGGQSNTSPQPSAPPPSNSSSTSKTHPYGADGALGPGHSPSG